MSKKIYIVDDDRDIVESISMVLESQGYEVGSQNVQKDVVKNVTEFQPDAIILDVIFPENESAGFEMARALRHDEATKSMPIMMLSAVNEKGAFAGTFTNKDRDEEYLPVDEFIEKPISPESLIERIAAIVG